MLGVVHPLTERHREILRLTAQGFRAREIARRCGITEKTVRAHLAEIRWRLRAPNTPRALVLALVLGELTLGELMPDEGGA
jgi:DNA-binding CsgD family transcriptional regulator